MTSCMGGYYSRRELLQSASMVGTVDTTGCTLGRVRDHENREIKYSNPVYEPLFLDPTII